MTVVELSATIWRPTSGIGEAGQSDDAVLITQDSFTLTTQDGIELQIQPASYTRLPATEWIESEGE